MGSFKGFLRNLLLIAVLLFAAHSYLLHQFFDGELSLPLWSIYLFNSAMVVSVYWIISRQVEKGSQKVTYTFLILTIGKMVLALVFLTPSFFGKSDHNQVEIFNFFGPYFLLLIYEVFSLSKFLQKL